MARKFRSLFLVSVLLLSFVVPSGSAYADGYAGVVYGPKYDGGLISDSNGKYGVVVNAGSSFDAALYAIGYSPDSSEFTSDVKAYLSNADTGGAFYTFAQKFSNHVDSIGDAYSGGVVGGVPVVGIDPYINDINFALRMYNRIYGPSNIWFGEFTSAERVAAVASVGLVLAGGVGGGGSSGPELSEDYEYFPTGGSVSGTSYTLKGFNGSVYPQITLDVHKANSWPENVNYLFTMDYPNSPTNLRYYLALSLPDGVYAVRKVSTGQVYIYNSTDARVKYVGRYYNFTVGGFVQETTTFVPNSGGSQAEYYINAGAYALPDNGVSYVPNYYYNDGVTTPVVPPTNWPEPDPTPTPEPPTVDPPTTPDPPNVPTTPTPPTYPPEVTYPDVTYVEADLTAVLDALNEHCEHLQHAIYTASSNLYSSLSSSISGEFTSLKTFMRALMSWNVDAINSNFDALYTYLTDFAVWLEGCIRADDIVLLLEGIYNTMGNLDASTNDLVDLSALESAVSDISADVELIVQALNNLQDDNDLLTIRGYLKGMYDWLHDFVIPDPVSVDLSNVEGYLSDISTDLDDFVHDFSVHWADLMNELDDIITAINNINFSERRWWKPIDIPDDPTVIVPVIRLPPEYYDPTNPRLPPFIEEPDAINIPALQAAFMELMTKFPFCMLNDLLNMLLYVVRPAAAPIFDLPVPNPSDWSSPHMITIDLSIFDPCAAMLRMGITLWVGVKLARRSVKMWTADNQEVVTV